MNLKKLNRLQQQVEQHKRDADRAAGALQQLYQRLRMEFKCMDLKQGKRLLVKLQTQEQELSQQFDVALAEFEKQYGDVLGESK